MFQCYVHADVQGMPQEISLQMYQRSADLFLGVPFNIASYGLLLCMIGHITGLRPKHLGISFGDLHIYESHIPEMLVQIRRSPGPLPKLEIGYWETRQYDRPGKELESVSYFVPDTQHGWFTRPENVLALDAEFEKRYQELDDFKTIEAFNLRDYKSQGTLSGKMAV